MSKIALSGNPSGTGTFTIASPNSNTDRVVTLPDVAGTVAVASSGTPNNTTFLRGDNVWAAPPSGGGAGAQVFTTSGTYTMPAGVKQVKVTVVGGGGASTDNAIGAAGGGSAIRWIAAASITAPVTVTVGLGGGASGSSTGGTSSFGAFVSATGGGGSYNSGGTGSGGDLNIGGQGSDHNTGGMGGSSILGGGGTSGQVGRNYGGGGGPRVSGVVNGGPGVVVVEEFY